MQKHCQGGFIWRVKHHWITSKCQTLDRPIVNCLESTIRSSEQSVGALEHIIRVFEQTVIVFGQTVRA